MGNCQLQLTSATYRQWRQRLHIQLSVLQGASTLKSILLIISKIIVLKFYKQLCFCVCIVFVFLARFFIMNRKQVNRGHI